MLAHKVNNLQNDATKIPLRISQKYKISMAVGKWWYFLRFLTIFQQTVQMKNTFGQNAHLINHGFYVAILKLVE